MSPKTETKHQEARRKRLVPLALAALGVVYGDIGTSPLYALRECFGGPHGVAVTRANVLGILSLVFWTLVVVVTFKYHLYVIRADNRGEGGILALMALVRRRVSGHGREVVLALGLFGAALLYADGVLTPAISVLGAVEGLAVVSPSFGALVVPVSVAILIGLFLIQSRGTAGVGAIFGPVMLLWFVSIALLGLRGIAMEPSVLAAIDPRHAIGFFLENGAAGFLVLGAVFLVATGGEALYADLGHFGERPIQIDWFGIVALSLVSNYFGQGALLLADPTAAENPFYRLAPSWALVPLLVLATAAAVIASQAIVSGAFSLTRQAVQLGYLPRLEIVHTSATEIGQIYVPMVNWALLGATVAVVLGFRSSSEVAAAYGVALTTTMLITTLLAHVAARRVWRWPAALAAAVTGVLLVPDLAFFGAAMAKVPDGGWFPLVLAVLVLTVMTTWSKGRQRLDAALDGRLLPLDSLLKEIERRDIVRVPGTAVYLTGDASGTPIALLHNLKLNRIVHERNLFLTVAIEEVPHVPESERLELRELGSGFHRLVAHFGFMEDPDVPSVLACAERHGLAPDALTTTFVLSRNLVVAAPESTFSRWRRQLFMVLSRNSQPAEKYFGLPVGEVMEIGLQVAV